MLYVLFFCHVFVQASLHVTPKANAGESNSMKSLRRLVSSRGDGSFLVPLEIVEKFKDIHGGGRAEVVRMWENHGCDKDPHFLETLLKEHVEHIEAIFKNDAYTSLT